MILGLIMALGIVWLWLYYEWYLSPNCEDICEEDMFAFGEEEDEDEPLKEDDEDNH